MATKGEKVVDAEYDLDSDSLALSVRGSRSDGAEEFGDIIIDFDKKGNIVGVELLGATGLLSGLTKGDVSSDDLKSIQDAWLTVRKAGKNIIVDIKLRLPGRVIETPLTFPGSIAAET